MIGFDSQTFIDIGTACSSGMKDWAPVIAATITGLVTLGTAVVIARIAHRQAETAANKLALDLFEKRFAVWKALEKAFGDVFDDARSRYMSMTDRDISAALKEAWIEAEVDGHWLFGPEIVAQLRRVGVKLMRLGSIELDLDDEADISERFDRFDDRLATPAAREFAKLRTMIKPYMMLDKIAVARPVKVEAGG